MTPIRYCTRWLTVLVVAVAVVGCTSQNLPDIHLFDPQGGEHVYHVEFANNDAQREKGLMDRATVDHGMLFLFDQPEILHFWMKNTLVPLDIVFFDTTGKFVSGTSMVPCTKDPCKQYPSMSPAQYALEMPQGFIGQEGVGSGWVLQVQR